MLINKVKQEVRRRNEIAALFYQSYHHIIDDRATIVSAFCNADKGARATLRYVAGNNINFFIEVCL